MKTVAIVQARMGSSRLPGKIIKKINGTPMLILLLKRISLAKSLDEIIVAIPKGEKNKILIKLLKNRFKYYQGSENNVLKRYYDAAKKHSADIIVRITSDNPLTPPELIDKLINKYKKSKFDYVCNAIKPPYPLGFGVEVFNFNILSKLYKVAKNNYDKEHVTSYIKKNYKSFKIYSLKNKKRDENLRLTVDVKEDLIVVRKIFEYFRPKINFKLDEIVKLKKSQPQLFIYNKKIKQK